MNTLSNVPDTFNRFSDKLPSISTENIKAPEFTLPEPKSFLMNGWTILTIILILGLLGFNIFTYLAKGTDMFGNTIKSLADIFTFGAKNTLETSEKGTNVLNKEIKKTSAEIGTGINRTVDNSATGSKTAVDVVADGVKSGVNLVTGSGGSPDLYERSAMEINKLRESNHRDLRYDYTLKDRTRIPIEADDDDSDVQQRQQQKGQYCYIGTDRGYRSCVKLGESDICMSGDIFPSKDICINPNLRH